jgi:hypothetical protein
MFWQSDFFGPFRQTKFVRLMELSHLILKYEEKSITFMRITLVPSN